MGGKTSNSVSKNRLCSSWRRCWKQIKKARDLGVTVLTEEEFETLRGQV